MEIGIVVHDEVSELLQDVMPVQCLFEQLVGYGSITVTALA